MKNKNEISNVRFWTLVWGLGLIGQLCWNMENQWFNTFVYAKIAKNPTIISWMVAISAIATTIATFALGTLSDRWGKRKPVIGVGYILWGIFTILFGTTQFIAGGAGKSSGVPVLAATAVVLADALMSFFGSMGNDAGYNAWTNDMMTDKNRGQIGASLATQPMIGTIAGTVIGGLLIGSDNNYMRLFVVMGGLVILFGFFTLIFMKDAPDLTANKQGSFWEQLISAFNIKELLKKKELVWVFLVLAVYFISFDVYFPHVGNYMIYYLGFKANMIGLIEGLALILGMLVVIPASKLINKDKFPLAASIAIAFSFVGIGILGLFVRPQNVDTSTIFNWTILIGLFFFGVGYIMFMQVLSVWMKQLFPKDSKGQFEGFRIIFLVLIPWIVSPFISNPIIMKSGKFIDPDGFTAYLPTYTLFLISTGLILLTFIPLVFAKRFHDQRIKDEAKKRIEK